MLVSNTRQVVVGSKERWLRDTWLGGGILLSAEGDHAAMREKDHLTTPHLWDTAGTKNTLICPFLLTSTLAPSKPTRKPHKPLQTPYVKQPPPPHLISSCFSFSLACRR